MNELEERHDRDALVAAGEGVGIVNIAVTGEAESGRERQRRPCKSHASRLLALLAERDTRVVQHELVGGMNLRVIGAAEECRVGATVQGSSG